MTNTKTLEKLEYFKIIQQVSHFANTEMAKAMILKMKPSFDLDTIQKWQDEVEESLAILEQGKTIPIPRLAELSMAFRRLEISAALNAKELGQIGRLLTTTKQVTQFFEDLKAEEKDYPALNYWVDQCVSLPQIVKEIQLTVSDEGSILNSASSHLAAIRKNQSQTESQIRNQLNQLLKTKGNQLSDRLITIRNDRYVLPVKAEYKGQFGGTIHDQSATGQTVFIEPKAVVDLNNRLAQLALDERAEIERILLEISLMIAPYVEEIKHNQSMIAQLDSIQSKAEYAKSINATKPAFSLENQVALWQARHPLIDPEIIVANDILIGEHYHVLLITGPNTGGKTIILKTIGLIQLMGQSGLHVPCDPGSQLGVFQSIYADIGDEQSIEQSLSTFSSHMTNIVNIIEEADYQSLVLFDELGSGTDPQEGAALAISILDYLRKVGATVLATTHYPELKVYAHESAKTINASMEFDVQTLSPTYRLMIGVPGRSNALEISKRLGLRQDIIEGAQKGISQDSQSLNEMVAKLERERRESELRNNEAQIFLEKAELLWQDLRTEYDRYLEQKQALMEKAKRQANDKVEQAQKQAEGLLQEIRDLQLVQGQNKTIKEHVLIDKKKAFDQLKQPENLRKNKVLKRVKKAKDLQAGDDVEVLSYGQRGTILEQVAKNEYIVQMGIIKMKIPLEELRPLGKVEPKQKVNIQRKAGSKVKTSLDIRGLRYEEAMGKLKQYLDQALLSNHSLVTIIHGKGTGALRQGVKDQLSGHPHVDHFEYSPPNAGGDGSTRVYFD
ncbi:endonuclease MutS2 [Facklamia miroungae]|uniref:Endonuclease MutS2 n=1 Tax=Facklamia miroungae TaxID=120956 RepID=A0A1G7QWU8_9LACT|nr:endonuclease MutS2 [Facklamia miroungae]NKZ29094.1 endonuclease MutS2 [Facklamia miroungae]SDG03001.1 DNA mismatch repair protein MutS2 [Facklamia miroungae]